MYMMTFLLAAFYNLFARRFSISTFMIHNGYCVFVLLITITEAQTTEHKKKKKCKRRVKQYTIITITSSIFFWIRSRRIVKSN